MGKKEKMTGVIPATRCSGEMRVWLDEMAKQEGKDLGEVVRETMKERVVRWMKGKVSPEVKVEISTEDKL